LGGGGSAPGGWTAEKGHKTTRKFLETPGGGKQEMGVMAFKNRERTKEDARKKQKRVVLNFYNT